MYIHPFTMQTERSQLNKNLFHRWKERRHNIENEVQQGKQAAAAAKEMRFKL